MPKVFTTQHTWYQSIVSTKLIYSYTHVINGFSANFSPKELQSLKTSPGYISSVKDFNMKLYTTHSPHFLGLTPNIGAWHDSEFGRDVIVGLVDTGIWPESKSFNDYGITKIPSKWKGHCDFNSSVCNKKLIGAKFFNKGLLAMYPNRITTLHSTRDTDGHGTHVSSIAAGSRVDSVSFYGYAPGTASGIAPNARVAMYKVAYEQDLLSSDVIAAIDAAISDGVDVLSLSLGTDEGRLPLYEDPLAVATFAAIEKGVFVSAAAGNRGPGLNTLHNGIPWVITVAAGVMDRDFQGTLTLGDGTKITGLSLYKGTFPIHNVPIVFMGLCENVEELKKVKSKIVVCEGKNGTRFYQLVYYLDEAKVLGAVFISNDSHIEDTENRFASLIIDPKNGQVVKTYINSSSNSSIASLSFKKTVFGTKPAPTVDSYSSRGPSYNCPFVLKPDITAPGTSILAAWPANVPVKTILPYKYFSEFNLLSGTSMACPHVAGVAALLKGAHHDWTPAAIRSAIMTTSDIFDNIKEPIKIIGEDNKVGNIANPFALGAGHVNPNRAMDPGLVYDVGVQDYVNLLCALNYSQKNISVITRSSSNDCSKPSLDLNYPSVIAFFGAHNSTSRTVQEFHRTVTNVGDGKATYVARVARSKGFRVHVIPNKLVFNEKNEKRSFKLRIEVARMTKLEQVAFGYLNWMDRKHVVRSPIVATTLQLKF
ncbi:hypothetical protein RYX36_014437 [Vicia faba]